MPLPFSKHDGKRQWQCFICGVLFPEFEAFKTHIRTTHEEGKEYIVCPLERCQAPVRDVRAHFKACHKYDSIPKNCQMRAMLWKDARDPKKRKKKVSFEEGYFQSAKNRKNLHYNSSWERQIYEVLEKMEDVARYEVEPIAIEYWFNGQQHNYLPDLRIHFRDGHKELWEVKPSAQTQAPINEAKWSAAIDYCKKRGWEWKVITEVGLSRLKNNLRLERD